MTKTILILGASGRFGRNGVTAFSQAGWEVRTFDRSTDELAKKARGVDVILNGWNPAYTAWAREVPELTQQVIAAAKSSGATVIIPGNVYNFGEDAPQQFSESTPHSATNPLGRVRIEMEAAYRRSGVRTILLRAGDFIDTEASGNWFDLVLTKKLSRGIFTYPGNPDIPHAWAYLPDLLRAAVVLADKRDQLQVFEDIPFPGYTLSGTELCDGLAAATSSPLRLKRMSYLPIRLLAPFWAMGRHLVEMSYLWNKPHHLDGTRFAQLLPDFQATPVAAALASSVSLDINPDKPMVGTHVAV